MKSLDTEILSIGTELLLGHVTNTDARDISELLSRIGVNVRWHTVVGDNPVRLRESVEIARARADVIVTTGGLGPTCDDLTKKVLAEAFALPLVRDQAEYDGLYDFLSLGRVFTPNNYAQADLPEGCTVFTPRHPRTRPKISEVEAVEAALDVQALVEEALAGTERIRLDEEL